MPKGQVGRGRVRGVWCPEGGSNVKGTIKVSFDISRLESAGCASAKGHGKSIAVMWVGLGNIRTFYICGTRTYIYMPG